MLRRALITTIAGASLLAPAATAAQSLASRINAAPANATVRFAFETKPGVCGDGENIMITSTRERDGMTVIQHRTGGGFNITNGRVNRDGRINDCRYGPATVELERSGGRIIKGVVSVGSTVAAHSTDLGEVTPAVAVDYLLSDAAVRAQKGAADRMIFAATLANAETWPALLRIARRQDLESQPRNTAMFWLAQAAGEKAAEGLQSIIGDTSDEIEIRKQAVFALSRVESESTVPRLMEIAGNNREPEIRKTAMFWLGQTKDPRALDFFEKILTRR